MKLLTLATTRQRLLLLAALLIALSLIIFDATNSLAGAQSPDDTTGPAGNVCPPGTTKYEADGGYEYGADMAEITVNGSHAEWQALTDAGNITRVCIKSGQSLYWPDTGPRAGAYDVPDGKDVSHVVIYIETPNAVEIADLAATRADLILDPEHRVSDRILILGLIAAALIYVAASLVVDAHRRRAARRLRHGGDA